MKKVYLVLIGLLLLALLPVSHIAWAATVTVNSTTDVSDGDTSSIASLIASPGPDGVITLREAIEAANNTPGSDTIYFNCGGMCTIQPSSELPALTDDGTIIDGSGGVILDGSGVPEETSGLFINGASYVVIRGLQILNFPEHGIKLLNGASHNTIGGANGSPGGSCSGDCNLISGNGTIDRVNHGVLITDHSANNTVSGNYIGTDINGTTANSNAGSGVFIGGAPNNIIGGTTAAERNVISGNQRNGVSIYRSAMNNTVKGNYIGTNANGTAALGNGSLGVWISGDAQYNIIGGTNTTPGGDCSGDCNLISGNSNSGVFLGEDAVYNTVSGNYIGTDINGTTAIPNNGGVIVGNGASYNVIGGSTDGERNLISGNGNHGVSIHDSGTTNNTIKGNYIGTDAAGTGDLGNTEDGVLLYDDAQDNTIGPGNAIAYNGRFGVLVVGPTSLGNTITQNSIHSNTEKGILLYDGGNLELFPPILTDLLTDRVSGVAPPDSTVEIFSDDEDEGRIFEGSTTTDATSHFTFNKPSGLAGPNTTATATDVDGNTSEFSTAYSVTHDMALVDIFSVKSKVQVGGEVTPTVEIGNAGSSTEVNIPVRVRVTTDPGGTEVYSSTETVNSISPLAYAFVTFEAWTPTTTGSYHVEASVTLPGDENGANDTKEVTVAAVVGNPEVYIEDNSQDDGSVPTNNYWMSPDIWVRHEEDGEEEHQQPIANQTNYAYARVHNIGDATLDNVTVDLYWHEPALAIKCGSWRPIGVYTLTVLSPGVTETIHLPWTPDVSGHTCLLAQIDSDQDPYARGHDCYEGVRWDNNLAQRNVEVVESAAAQVGAVSVAGIRLDVVNVRSKPASVDVVVEKTEAFTGTLTLDLGEELFNRWQNATGATVEGGQVVSGTTKVQITAPVSGTVVGLPLYEDEEVEVVLEAEGQSGLEFEVEVVEWIDGLLIGGNTYQLKLPYHDIYLPIMLKGHSSS
jgi:hypothetical protein